MDNSRGIQAGTHCEITNMHNIEHKEDSKSVIYQLTYYSLNLSKAMAIKNRYYQTKTISSFCYRL